MNDEEKLILGAILRFPEVNLKYVLENLTSDDFGDKKCRKIFDAIIKIHRENLPLDLMLLSETSNTPVSELLEIQNEWIDGLNLSYHCQRLREQSNRKRLEETLRTAMKDLKNGKSPEVVLNDLKNFSLMETSNDLKLPRFSDFARMETNLEWIVENLIPKNSITILHGQGGIKKTWLSLQICKCVQAGQPFLNLSTSKTSCTFIDFENPLPILCDRVKILGDSDFQVWHVSHSPQPPLLDSKNFHLYKRLNKGLMVIDSLRSAFTGDENNSQDVAEVMRRLKELRDSGFTVLLIHHTPKSDPLQYKGSTAIIDLADHTLSLDMVDSESELLHLGTRGKTRFLPSELFLRFNPFMGGFEIGESPNDSILEKMYEVLKEAGQPLNFSQFFEAVRERGILKSKSKFNSFAKEGIDRLWRVETMPPHTTFYHPIVDHSPIVQTIYSQTTGLSTPKGSPENEGGESPQTIENAESSNSPEGIQTNGLQEGKHSPVVPSYREDYRTMVSEENWVPWRFKI